MKKSNFSIKPAVMVFAALALFGLLWSVAAPPAGAKVRPYDGDLADIKGLWLEVPGFPKAKFADDGAKRREQDDEYGYFSFRRGLAGDDWVDNRWSLVVDRYRHSDESLPDGDSFYPVTAEKAKKFLVAHGAIGAEDEVEVIDDQAAAEHLTYPVTRSRCDFKTGNDEALSSFDTFIFTDDYLFWIHLTAPTAEAERFSEDDFKAWFEGIKFQAKEDQGPEVREMLLESPAYPARARVIESTRYIDVTMFKIRRYAAADGWGPKRPEEVPAYIRQLVKDGNGEMGEIRFDPKADALASKRFNQPCAGARYTEGFNEDSNIVNRLFIFVGEYVFDVEIAIDADSYEDEWPQAAGWLETLQFTER